MRNHCVDAVWRFALLMPMLAMGLVPGCSMPQNPWTFAAPPTAGDTHRGAGWRASAETVVVVGRFEDPSRAPNYSQGVGRALSDAFGRVLMREARVDVRIDDHLAAEALRYTRFEVRQRGELTDEQKEAREALERDRADVDYVILGKVTDFYHTSDLPSEASRWGILGRRNEAIVSIDLRIVDMQTLQVVGTDHLMGRASVGRARSHELYENVALDSYVFWSTPLGRAGRTAIDRAVAGASHVVARQPRPHGRTEVVRASAASSPGEGGDTAHHSPHAITVSSTPRSTRFDQARPTVLRVDDARRLTVMGGRNLSVRQGDRFELVYGSDRDQTVVIDPVTKRPLLVAITDVSETTATGWLVGQKPRQLDLRGMSLREAGTMRREERAAVEASP